MSYIIELENALEVHRQGIAYRLRCGHELSRIVLKQCAAECRALARAVRRQRCTKL